MILHDYLYEDYASMHNVHQHPYVPLAKKKQYATKEKNAIRRTQTHSSMKGLT